MPLEIPRRKLITGLISFIAAPAIVQVANIMPVHSMEDDPLWQASWRPLYRCPYCGSLRGGMCPTCWRNALMPGLADMVSRVPRDQPNP
jgi:hypothetical protein